MTDSLVVRLWLMRGLFILLVIAVFFVSMLPLSIQAGNWPGPDWIMALTFAWVMRRPDYVPVLMIAGVALAADMIYLRPPGLYAAMLVLGSEFLRSREPFGRDLPLPVEWAMVSAVMVMMALACRLVMIIFVVDQPRFGLEMIQLGATILVYPLVVAASRYVFGVRKVAPGEVDELGHRI